MGEVKKVYCDLIQVVHRCNKATFFLKFSLKTIALHPVACHELSHAGRPGLYKGTGHILRAAVFQVYHAARLGLDNFLGRFATSVTPFLEIGQRWRKALVTV